jgi:hypothetical protein
LDIKIELKGFKELEKNFKDLQRKAQEINGTNNVTFSELFSSSFLSMHSKFSSIDELFSASSFKISSQDDFEKIPQIELDNFIKNNTDFNDWEEMFNAAFADWTKKKLF